MTIHTAPIHRGLEVDLITDRSSWSVRLAQRADGDLSVIVTDHMSGSVALAELIPVTDTEHAE